MITTVDKTMPFLPAMTGNGKHTAYKFGDDCGEGLLLFYPHYSSKCHKPYLLEL